jgi:hypothetical protein
MVHHGSRRSIWTAAIILFLAGTAPAQGGFRVNEAATRISLGEHSLDVALAVATQSAGVLPIRCEMDLLDPENTIVAHLVKTIQVEPATALAPMTLDLPGPGPKQPRSAWAENFLWYRVRYRLTAAHPAATTLAQGILPVGNLLQNAFNLEIAAWRMDANQRGYQALVRATHPITGAPVEGVNVQASITFDKTRELVQPVTSSGLTDARGYATLLFNLPLADIDRALEMQVAGHLYGYAAQAEHEFQPPQARILITTDKTLYQPGQVLHTRAVALAGSGHAIVLATINFTVKDPDGQIVFRNVVNTSRFGVAHTDWTIPDHQRIGAYSVEGQVGQATGQGSSGSATVNISRYELPQFTVRVKPDRAYYLPGQDASVEIHGEYLFGKPVVRGRVKIVEDDKRTWDWRVSKWNIRPGAKYEGEADGQGNLTQRIELQTAQRVLAANPNEPYQDIQYTAYLSDPSTGRTEQRRFDLRITREPIHVYALLERFQQNWKLPLKLYVATSYADGSPAECEVEIRGRFTSYREANAHDPGNLLATVHTNQFGLAKITGLKMAPAGTDFGTLLLNFNVRDAAGRTGHGREELWGNNYGEALRVETNKALYGDGEPIDVQITGTMSQATVQVNVVTKNAVVLSQQVKLRDGHARLQIPYRPSFAGDVIVGALVLTAANPRSDDWEEYAYRTVIYPRPHGLNLRIRLDQDTHRPGEQALADFESLDPRFQPIESDLGIVVFDKAVAERARANQESNGSWQRFFHSNLNTLSVGGVTRDDLDRVDFSKPLPEGLDLVAEFMLANAGTGYSPQFFNNQPTTPDLDELFEKQIKKSLKPLEDALKQRYRRKQQYPKDEATLRQYLSEDGVDFYAIRDPWGSPYHADFSSGEQSLDMLKLNSIGPDKKLGTADDFDVFLLAWASFRPQGDILKRAFESYHRRTDGYIHDVETLRGEARKQGLDIDKLRDRWGQPYRYDFAVDRTVFTLSVVSGGPDKHFEKPQEYPDDDFTAWSIETEYSIDLHAKINAALVKYFAATGIFPRGEPSFTDALLRDGIDWRAWRDPWDHPYFLSFDAEAQDSDRIKIREGLVGNNDSREQEAVKPVTLGVEHITLQSVGPDGRRGTKDDFVVAEFDRAVSEPSADQQQTLASRSLMLAKGSGVIAGSVRSESGDALTGATVRALRNSSSKAITTTAGEEGAYAFRNLTPGDYIVSFVGPGYMPDTVIGVPVSASHETNLYVELRERAAEPLMTFVSEDITPADVFTDSSIVAGVEAEMFAAHKKVAAPPPPPPPPPAGALGTPRLRQYFPETLVWEPELITDRNGRAQLKFTLADNITTWEMSVIGSTEDGEIGTAEKEFRAFQPFFLQLDPPPVLTQGDEIALPVVVRNYLDKAQALDLEMAPADWFSLLSPARQHTEIAAGESAKQIFSFQATKKVTDGRQRVTAIGSEASDAIERKVSVHPDGQEITETQNQLLGQSASLAFTVPKGAIPGSAEARVEVYPNLMAHVIAAIEGILERPNGCTEQIISSAYPSLLLLRYYKLVGHADPALEAKARRYLQLGYDRLLANQTANGGFNYWGHGDPDVALTAYALRFLADASEFIPVNGAAEHSARSWLEKEQQKDGRWPAHLWYSNRENIRQSALLTAYVAQMLAALREDSTTPGSQTRPATRNPVAAALDYLRPKVDEIDEPYLIASYTLAALAAHNPSAAEGLKRLRTLAHPEARGTYWALETNTPFYGWGLAGRIEATALAVQALSRASQATPQNTEDQNLIHQGLLFLFAQKDRYGIWYSTQATVNVLQALTLIACDRAKALETELQVVSASQAEVMVNGRAAGKLALPPPNQPAGPVELDLSPFIDPGRNRIEILLPESSSAAWVALVGTHYEPWKKAPESETHEATRLAAPGNSSGLRLAVDYTSTRAKVDDAITCHVSAERVGFQGYGMLLAEIGLPPGAEVDRESLEHAAADFKTGIGRYEVMPDRVVFYLWPQAGGVRFSFTFKFRYGLKALSTPSVLYDYYNPLARAEVEPTQFLVQ